MPAETQPLPDFIEAMKSQGATDEFVVALLRQNGWSEKRIYHAFGAWYEARTGKVVPNGGGRIEAAKDAFLYLLAFITLAIWTIQLGALLFYAIDRTFPNPALDYANSSSMTRSIADELASMIVAFPLFLLVTRGIVRGVQLQPERLESPVRKWLTYLTLVITASAMIGDVVTFLAYFLRGDLDTRFTLKVLTVLVIAGGVLAYYLDSLHREKTSSGRNRLFVVAALAVVALGLAVGFMRIGSPAVQRSVSQDSRRLFDLSSLAQRLHASWIGRGDKTFVLPATIQEFPAMGSAMGASVHDPVSGLGYGYMPSAGTLYRLCSVFLHPSPANVPRQWQHAGGNVCFALDASQYVELVQREW